MNVLILNGPVPPNFSVGSMHHRHPVALLEGEIYAVCEDLNCGTSKMFVEPVLQIDRYVCPDCLKTMRIRAYRPHGTNKLIVD